MRAEEEAIIMLEDGESFWSVFEGEFLMQVKDWESTGRV